MTKQDKYCEELLRKYFLKLEKDVFHGLDIQIKEALKDKDYPKVIKLQGVKDGVFSVIAYILHGCLFYGRPTVEAAIKKYLRTNIYKKKR
jgi:hypothetical protein